MSGEDVDGARNRGPILLTFACLLILPLSVVPVAAYTFDDYVLEVSPSEHFTHEAVTFTLINDGEESLREGNYTISATLDNVQVFDDRGLIPFTASRTETGTTIIYHYRSPIPKGGVVRVTISFDAIGMVGKSTYIDDRGRSEEQRVLSTAFKCPSTIRRLKVRVLLPEGAWLARSLSEHATMTGSPVQPLDARILSNGTSLGIYWERSNLSRDDRFDFYVAYRFPGAIIRTTLTPILGSILVGVLVGAATVYLFLRKRAAETKTRHTLALLEEGERRVLKIIMDAGGEIRQDELMKTSGYSRARVSQLVTHLEKLKLIRKERFERTNKLILTGEITET